MHERREGNEEEEVKKHAGTIRTEADFRSKRSVGGAWDSGYARAANNKKASGCRGSQDLFKKARDRLEQVREQPTEMEARKRRVMNFIEKTTRRESAGMERKRRVTGFIRRTARTSSESEQDVLRYLKDVQYPATKDELVSAARSNDAPEELLVKLVGLTIREYSSPREVAVAVDSRRSTGA